MRIVFMGTPQFAVPSLAALAEAGYELPLVITQPDRQAGRGRKLTQPPVKQAAAELGIRVVQPPRIGDPAVVAAIREAAPDIIVVAAYGQILPTIVLSSAAHSCINVHASLLPRWRGAAPISAAIVADDALTGVSLMQMAAGLDNGPIISQQATSLDPEDDAITLERRLSLLGAQLLLSCIDDWVAGRLCALEQDERQVTLAPRLTKRSGALSLAEPGQLIWRKTRAYAGWPSAYLYDGARRLRLLRTAPLRKAEHAPIGQVNLVQRTEVIANALYPGLLDNGRRIAVLSCPETDLALLQVQTEGAKPVSGQEWLAGRRGAPPCLTGSELSDPPGAE